MGLETAPSEGRETVTAVDFAEVVVRCHVDGLTGSGGRGSGGHTFSLLGSANGLSTVITG